MAKSLKDTLKLGPKIELKKTEKNIEDTEKVVALIHDPTPVAAPAPQQTPTKVIETVVEETSEITKRVTLDIPLHLHAEIKMKTFRSGSTIKEYLLNLAKKDLGL